MLEQLSRVVGGVLGLAPQAVDRQTSMETCPAWDSLRHFEVILAVEAAFGVRFAMEALPELTSLAALQDALAAVAEKKAA